jgi:hypothetical protein
VFVVDYAKLAEEEKERQDAAHAAAEAEHSRQKTLLDFFDSVETHLSEEISKANQELGKRGDPTFSGPNRSSNGEERIDLAYGSRNPACKLTLQTTAELGLSRILVELLSDTGDMVGSTDYVMEQEGLELRAYKSLVEGFPDHASAVTSAEIAQQIVPGIIRGRFE